MTHDALRKTAFWRDPDARIRVDFTVPEATLLYGLTHAAYLVRQAADPLDAGSSEADLVLNRASCKLYVGLRENCGRGL